jgi:lysozyme family protein
MAARRSARRRAIRHRPKDLQHSENSMHWTYEPAMEQGVFPHEGGYTNDPRDPGGPTNWGITIFDARKYWKSSATAADVKTMPKSVAEAIYWPHYAVPLCYDDLPAGPDYAALDYGINSGVSRAAKVIQRLVGMNAVDGVIGAATLAAIGRRDPEALVNAICDERIAFLRSLKTFSAFGKGWTRRVTEVRALALHFADQAKHIAPQVTPTQADESMAKGVIPPPTAAKKVIQVGGGGAAVGTAGGFHEWIMAHPLETGALALGIVVMIGGTIYAINRDYRARQDAPTPGIAVVPEKAVA